LEGVYDNLDFGMVIRTWKSIGAPIAQKLMDAKTPQAVRDTYFKTLELLKGISGAKMVCGNKCAFGLKLNNFHVFQLLPDKNELESLNEKETEKEVEGYIPISDDYTKIESTPPTDALTLLTSSTESTASSSSSFTTITSTRPRRLLLKIIILGDSGVGKTAILNRYVHNRFYDSI